jgi:two-component system phosphate regulon sensor histidine kinase PhoR
LGRRKLIWQIFPPLVVVTAIAVALMAWQFTDVLHESYLEQIRTRLFSQCSLIEATLTGEPTWPDADSIQKKCIQLGKASGTRITIITPDGVVVGDSEQQPAKMVNHLSRPEVAEAIATGTGSSRRQSETLGQEMMYAAIAVKRDGKTVAIVRTSIAVTSLEGALDRISRKVAWGGAVVVLLVAGTSLWISVRITRPIRAIKESARAYADGDLQRHVERPKAAELAELADAMERMAVQLAERISAVTEQKNQLQRLENMRRDFVANVSHELRTPVTSIKGFVETLQEQGIGDAQEGRRYLDIIARHTDRLNAIIEDLLSLSAIEEDNDRGRIEFSKESIRGVLVAAAELSMARAKQKDIAIDVVCDPILDAQVNALLLEQAVVNLIDNAVKYSNAGSRVNVVGQRNGSMLEIYVKDEGCGIAAEYLPRIFERFYVVDKARSRKLGGTGLGLAIVKHIVQSHRGSVDVASEAGKGSTFTIRLPLKQS